MAIMKYDDLPEIRKKHSNDQIVICSGSFDIIHAGHVLFFENCKKLGSPLVTILAGDEALKKYKGPQRPIMPQEARLKLLDSLKPIDYTILDDFSQNSENYLYSIGIGIELLRPDIYVINEDATDISLRKKICERYGVDLKILPRTHPEEFGDISTSNIIKRIKNLNDNH